MATATAVVYEYKAGSEILLYALKRRKVQKQRGFRAKSTYGHCIKDKVLIDPCMGSGHILVYAFDVLMQIYESAGYSQREAAKSILEHNLYGLDIDDRAFQIAYFAVMMKARQYNRRILNGETDCHVYSIQESNGVNRSQLKYFGAGLSELEKNNALNQMNGLLDTFVDAKEYGSILNMENYDWNLLRRFVEKTSDDAQMSMDSIGLENAKEQLQLLINIGQTMAQKIDVVVTNPPYMGSNNMGAKLSEHVKKYYPDSKSDLFAAFIKRCKSYLKSNRMQAMITQQGWMFASNFNVLRHSLLNNTTIVNLLHLGAKTFDNDVGTIVQSVAFVLCNAKLDNYVSTFFKITEYGSSAEKAAALLSKQNKFTTKQNRFFYLPANPVAYWVSDAVIHLFVNEKKIGDILTLCAGLSTGNNDLFCRNWYEVSYDRIKMDCSDVLDTIECNQTWFPCNSGGVFHKWSPFNLIVVNWRNNGVAIRNYQNLSGKIASAARNTSYYFKEGLTWNKISTNFAFMYKPTGFIFDDTSRSAFAKQGTNMMYVLALLNSKVALYLLKSINQTFCFTNGDIEHIPYVYNNKHFKLIVDLCKRCVSIEHKDLTLFETSWNFKTHPLVAFRCNEEINQDNLMYADDLQNGSVIVDYGKQETPIALACDVWERFTDQQFKELKSNEEELNRIFIDIYGLQDELTPEVEDKDVTVRKADLQRDIKSLLSYAVGCMFGRYSLDVLGLVYAGGEWDDSKYSSFIPDKDNILPITDEEYFEDDIVGLFCAWLKRVYGEETLEENLDFIAKALGNKGNTSHEIIRDYFLNDFFKDHCKIYKKRPIYWLFDSGKQNGFKALIYMHRYDENTIGNLRIDYLHRMERIYESEIARMQDIIDNSQNAREVTAATKRKEKLQKQVKECKEYDEKIAHLALARIAIDLDDGVKVNYEKVQTVDGKKYDVLAKI